MLIKQLECPDGEEIYKFTDIYNTYKYTKETIKENIDYINKLDSVYYSFRYNARKLRFISSSMQNRYITIKYNSNHNIRGPLTLFYARQKFKFNKEGYGLC